MEYVVKAGDTLARIAAAHGTTVQALLAANPFVTNQNLILVGWRLRIPTTAAPATAPPGPVVNYAQFVAQHGAPPPVPGSPEAMRKAAEEAAKRKKQSEQWLLLGGGLLLLLALVLPSR
jgi:LysM repeat protein